MSGGGAAILDGSLPRRRERGVAAGRCPSSAGAAPRGCGERAAAGERAGSPGDGHVWPHGWLRGGVAGADGTRRRQNK